MKCPKCGYLGFASGERCRNCGYDFSLIADADSRAARQTPSVSSGGPPLRDPRLARGSRYQQPSATPGEEGVDKPLAALPEGTPVDLPLFRGDAPILPPPRAPLAVRRATPTPARVRSRTPTPQPETLPLAGAEPVTPSSPLSARQPANAPERPESESPLPAATAGERTAAAAIDLGLLLVIDVVVLHFTLALCGLNFNDLHVLPVLPMAAFLVFLNGGYFILFTGTLGQTFGKMATSIEVVPCRHDRMDLGRAVLRAAATVLSLLPAGLGWLAGLVGDHRGLHDRLAGTRVVRVAGA